MPWVANMWLSANRHKKTQQDVADSASDFSMWKNSTCERTLKTNLIHYDISKTINCLAEKSKGCS